MRPSDRDLILRFGLASTIAIVWGLGAAALAFSLNAAAGVVGILASIYGQAMPAGLSAIVLSLWVEAMAAILCAIVLLVRPNRALTATSAWLTAVLASGSVAAAFGADIAPLCAAVGAAFVVAIVGFRIQRSMRDEVV